MSFGWWSFQRTDNAMEPPKSPGTEWSIPIRFADARGSDLMWAIQNQVAFRRLTDSVWEAVAAGYSGA